MKSVSVVIPTYNMARFVREAVDSVLAQTYGRVEVIVVDDGSTDNTKEILGPYIKKGTIRYLAEPHRSLPAARNVGIRAASGDYIALLDADDIFLKHKLERQVAHLEASPSADASYSAPFHFMDGAPQNLMRLKYRYYSGDDVLPNIIKKFFIAPSTVVFKKRFFSRYGFFDETVVIAEDFDFWLRSLHQGARVEFFPEPLVKIRMHGSDNADHIQKLARQPELKLMSLRGIENFSHRLSDAERARYNIRSQFFRYRAKVAFAYLLVGEKKKAKEYLRSSVSEYRLGFLMYLPAYFFISLSPAFLIKKIVGSLYAQKRVASFEKA